MSRIAYCVFLDNGTQNTQYDPESGQEYSTVKPGKQKSGLGIDDALERICGVGRDEIEEMRAPGFPKKPGFCFVL